MDVQMPYMPISIQLVIFEKTTFYWINGRFHLRYIFTSVQGCGGSQLSTDTLKLYVNE